MMMSEQGRSSGFLELKGYCLQLFQLLRNPNNKGSTSTISQLLHFIRRSPLPALQPFFDYTLLPLLLLLEAAVDCRSPPKDEFKERSVFTSATEKPPKVGDAVAEGVLHCLEELLMKCHVGSVDQMVVILKKLTNAALLSPSEAAEEFREGVIRCFKALLLGLCLCSNTSCTCKQINSLSMVLDKRYAGSLLRELPAHELNPEECLLAFLRSQSATITVGHWLSLLLKAADVEASRGHIGSSKLRIEAFMTLRVLVAKVGTADQLAFFLPGVVSQIGKVLHVSKTMISGAAGSMEAMDQALRGLAEFLMIVLQDEANTSSLDDNDIDLNTNKSPLSFLEELRHLPGIKQDQGEIIATKSIQKVIGNTSSQSGFIGNEPTKSDVPKSLHVDRTKDWIATASSHVNKLLSATFPDLCVHPAKRVRQGTMAAIQGLLSTCSHTLKGSRLMLLECVCALVSDDDEEVSAAAQMLLGNLLSSSGKHHVERDLADIFNRLFEKLPEVVVGGEKAVAHSQKLLVLIYYSGPQLVKDHLLQSPVTAARFFDNLSLCLSQNSVFSGSLDKLLLERPSSVGYLRSITEMKATAFFANKKVDAVESNAYEDPYSCEIQNEYDLPRMPPWFASSGNQKLYQALSGIIRLVSLSLVAGSQSEGSLSIIKDIPLSYLRKLIGDIRNKEYTKENWQSWYNKTNSGKLVRQASTAVCILNEMIFGLSDQAVDDLKRRFHKSSSSREGTEDDDPGPRNKIQDDVTNVSGWNISLEDLRSQLIDCVGSILHEYLSSEVWNLPLEQSSAGAGDVTVHFFRDNAMLHQVIIDGIGIYNLCLKSDFLSSGFLHSSLYVLLENLICSNFQIRRASDAVLHVIAATSGYLTVGHLVLANSDYVIDSICRQLRHLDLNPHVPSVLAAILSYIGVAHKILPLMEEPMRSISQELEILGRHQHPELTISFLRAVAEIAKASKLEACSLPSQAELYHKHVKSELSDVERETMNRSGCSVSCFDDGILSSPEECEVAAPPGHVDKHREQWERIFFRLKESKSYRQTVGSISSSCIVAATPLLGSMKQTACLVALQIVEDGIMALAEVEESYRHEMKTREILTQALQSYSLDDLADTVEAESDGTEENRLLPAMNKIWPFLIACIRNGNPLATRRCAGVMSRAVQICGGDFFSRRFHTDGSHLWKLLSASPFQKKKERRVLQLPYRSGSEEDGRAEISDLKVQVAVLDMIAEIAGNKKSASALESVFKKVCGVVVGIACSGVGGVGDASVNALRGLATVDPDLIWLLLADIYYSKKREGIEEAAAMADLPQLVPPALSSPRWSYLYVEYGGQRYGFDMDLSAVESVFKKLYDI
ncbi:TELO2-interacting protein 1 homolog [Cynara cardunculus var. scolymus]|uniref:TELO2-interacting protein 1 homolog n=1 Tax=Cynara cardunculus var. scolymus TaxID=59895 RepID=UPI000D62EA48|nr:TELO2-interacting protein 1 homolog [Cynara cardunculus var. scolymus]